MQVTTSTASLWQFDHILLLVADWPAALVADDFNNDGKKEIAVANWYTDDVTIFLRK